MELKEFTVETWMTNHELDCKYNMSDTCVKPMTLNELSQLTNEDLISKIMNMTFDYGPITGSDELKKEILSLYTNGDISNIAILHGAINANQHVMDTLLNKGDHIISMTPSYEQFYTYPLSIGCTYDLVELNEENNWQPTITDFKNLIKDNTKMIILNSPNNPTGHILEKEFISELIKLCEKHKIYILVDEIYKGLHKDKYATSICDLTPLGIVTGGLSKVYSFAGLRIGWIKASKDIIDKVNLRRDYTIISSGLFDDYIATIVLKHKDKIIERNNKIVNANKELLKNYILNEPILDCVIPKDGTVAFIKYHHKIKSIELCETLQKETGVFFVPGKCFDKEYHLRFGFTQETSMMKKGLEILSDFLRSRD